MKIYTKTGDKGTTALIGGKRTLKSDDRLNAYGTVDELNSFLGLLRTKLTDEGERIMIFEIQNSLFSVGANLATAPGTELIEAAKINPIWIENLEKAIDKLDEALPAIKSFIIYGENESSAVCHVCRAITRRAERATILVGQTEPIDELVVKYLNRLSDFLYTFARYLAKKENQVEFFWQK